MRTLSYVIFNSFYLRFDPNWKSFRTIVYGLSDILYGFHIESCNYSFP